MIKLKWEKVKHAPIPDFHDRAGRFRIYKSQGFWKLQDRQSPNHPEPILWAETMHDAKAEAIYQLALDAFSLALASTSPAVVEDYRTGCGLGAAHFACRYVRPEKDHVLYGRIYDIYWGHFHKEATHATA